MLPFPAPEGPDGKLWHFERLCMHALWFSNVPNCPGGTPNALMVPREVPKADGLRITE